MKQKLLLKTMLLLCALVAGSMNVWADATPYVTADFTAKTANNNNYTNTWTYGDWSLMGCANNNGDWAYIRCGGKGGSENSSTQTSSTIIKGTVAIDKAIKEVKLLHNGTNNASITINSFKLEVASDASFETITNTITDDETEISKEVGGTITFDDGAPYAANSYYRITINWTVKGKKNYGLDVTKIEFYEDTGKADAGLAFSPTSVSVNIGGEETVSFTKTTDATASFVVADETIATYNSATGKISGLKEGTTTITATTAENATYSAGVAVCTITVVDPDWLDYTKKGYANAADVTTETCANGTVVLAKADGSDSPKWYNSGSAVRIYKDNTITITAKSGYVLTSVEFSVTSGSMSASAFNKTVKQVGKTNEFVLSVPATEIVYTVPANFRVDRIKLNIAEPATITLASACTDGAFYYGTYSNSKAFVVPADLIVSEVSVIDGKLYVEDYNEGDIVPANTGVMVSSDEAGAHTVALTAETGTSVLGSDNMLKASGDAGISASEMTTANPAAGTKFYRLTMHNGTTIGFWWGAAEGAAFSLAANKAYLAVPAGAAREGFGFDETTGIGAALNDNVEMINDNVIYDLSGRRVEHPTKGIYIKNGKKVVIR